MTDLDDFLDSIDDTPSAPVQEKVASAPVQEKVAPPPVAEQEPAMSAEDFMAEMGLEVQRTVPDISKPWMKHHEFVLVKSIDQLREIVDSAIANKRCSLDLETEGLDNRIFYDAEGKPYTKHKVVGFCISTDGHTGYYVPVRHKPEDGGTNLNLPEKETEAEITRLCLAAQPKVSKEGLESDPLSCKDQKLWEAPPQLVIYFWNAKFDQEFLYPITGIDWWHPESFEDGNLAYYVYFSSDKKLKLKDKALEVLRDPEGHPYEMIRLQELFVQGRKDIRFALLAPDEPGCIKYACSDAICTFLLCTAPRKHEKERVDVFKIVQDKYAFTYRLEKQTAQTGRWQERPRVRVNPAKIEPLRAENLAKKAEVEKQIKLVAQAKGFYQLDLASSKVLSEFLFEPSGLDIKLPIEDKDFPGGKPERNEKSGQYKTDADTLEQMEAIHPNPPDILKWIVEWRQLEKLEGTYYYNLINNVDERGEMRFQFKQTGAATGRYSAPAGEPDQGFSGIPIHGIPKTSAIRAAFEARDGYTFIKSDYAGEELRIASNVSGEEVWIKEFLEGTGDLHTITARAFFGKQDVSKEERNMGKCVHPDTLVVFNGKLQPIGRIAKFPEAEDTFAEARGEIYDGQVHRPIKAVYNGGQKPLVHVVTTQGIVTCTFVHQFQKFDGSFCEASGLTNGDVLAEVRKSPRLLNTTLVTEVSQALQAPLGLLAYWTTDDLVLAGQVCAKLKAIDFPFVVSLTETGVRVDFDRRSEGPAVVLRVINRNEMGPVVDLTVDYEDHVYMVNGLISHNTANFALIYGGGPAAVMRATGCDKMEATRRKQAFDKAVPAFAKWVKGQQAFAHKNGGVFTSFGRWVALPDINHPDRKVQAANERVASNAPIQGAGADILKISLTLLFKEFYKRGWLKQNNGDDSVRILLCVHDEIVFEVRHDRVNEVLPIITKIMASPGHMAKWKVPLVVEPLIGLDWGAEYDYGMLMHGKSVPDGYKPKPKEAHLEVVIGNKAYHRVPPWLEGMLKVPYLESGEPVIQEKAPEASETAQEAPKPVQASPASIPPQAPSQAPAQKPQNDVVLQVVTLKIGILTKKTVKQVKRALAGACDPDSGKVVCIIDAMTGTELISPSRGIRVNVEELAKDLQDLNLSDGTLYPYVRPGAPS